MTRPHPLADRPILESFNDSDLRDELQRRENERQLWRERNPAFRCLKCGETAHFHGPFKSHLFERQKAEFDRAHAGCLPIYGGGCI